MGVRLVGVSMCCSRMPVSMAAKVWQVHILP